MPRPHITNALRHLVIERARGLCEYCLVHQDDRPESHQIDHILALKHGGETVNDNLALACAVCNNYKGTDLASIDPFDRSIVPLFNPRTQNWYDHFRLTDARVIGLTPIGRATAELLHLNDEERLYERQELMTANRYPPGN